MAGKGVMEIVVADGIVLLGSDSGTLHGSGYLFIYV